VGANAPSLELVRLSAGWQAELKSFLDAIGASGDDFFFSPHPTDSETLHRLAAQTGMDLYYLLVEGNKVLGYGLLRGWDEGFQVPSLGIAIHPSHRGSGLGGLLMRFLHATASRRGASRIRLRVLKSNAQAIRLYESLGYIFEFDSQHGDYLVGMLNLTGDAL
jgi:ribosomal protein S18 acetylase RimI-like enzyme